LRTQKLNLNGTYWVRRFAAGANAKVIEAVEESPSPGELEGPKPRRTRRKAGRDVGSDVGTAPDEAIS
jgi:hypothetical protein